MMVANSFDLWQKDAFFSAAEEVQESADIMESAYRLWVRQRREGLKQEDLDELCRELQTALGTAKWQLEEFERAVRLSDGHRCNDNSTARHKQFITAMENQISRVEEALKKTFNEEGKKPLRWVNLDQEERDDLAMFLSGTSPTSPLEKHDCFKLQPPMRNLILHNNHVKKDARLNLSATCAREISDELKGSKEAVSISTTTNSECIIEVADESPETSDDIICQAGRTNGTRKTWSSPNFTSLKIVVADEGGNSSNLKACVESTPKEKGFKPIFWKQKCLEHPQAKGAVNLYNQLFGGVQRQRKSPMRLVLALMLTIFLIVPFVFYST